MAAVTAFSHLSCNKPYFHRPPLTSSPIPSVSLRLTTEKTRFKRSKISSSNRPDPEQGKTQVPVTAGEDDEVDSVGVKVALSMLGFYKREISPLIPKSCRYVPSCSEYSMEAYKRYGVVKGTVLTAWRLCRCNPLGGTGFDPPRWFGEEAPPPLE